MAKKEYDFQAIKGMAEPAKGSTGRLAEKSENREGLFAEVPAELLMKLRIMSVREKRTLREIVAEGLEIYVASKEKQSSN